MVSNEQTLRVLLLAFRDPRIIAVKDWSLIFKTWGFLLLPKNCSSCCESPFSIRCKKATCAVTTLREGSSGSQVLVGGLRERQPPPPTHPPLFGKQGNSNEGGAWGRGQGARCGYSKASDWWFSKCEDLRVLIGSLPGLTAPVPTGGASGCCAPPRAGGCPPRAAERVRARSTPVRCPPARPLARLRTVTVSGRAGAAEVTAGRRGGGSMAASLWLRGAASGLRYWSRRQRPAAASLAAGKDLAPPSPSLLRPPPSRDLAAEAVFFAGGAAVGSGLTSSDFWLVPGPGV